MIEDDPSILALNEMALGMRGAGALRILKAQTLAQARALLNGEVDLVLLDLMLPDGSGLEFVQEIRRHTVAPVLMLTAMWEQKNRLEGLRAGGNDYITKPYNVEELCEKVVNMLELLDRAGEREQPNRVETGRLTLDLVSGRAFAGARDLLLTPKEFALLHYLMRNQGKTVPREMLYTQVWKQPMAGDVSALQKAVSSLRKKLRSDHTLGIDIETVRQMGYRLMQGRWGAN